MGIFKRLAKVIIKVAEAPRAAVAKVCEKVGDAIYLNTYNRPCETLGKALSNFGSFIMPSVYKEEEATAVQIRDFGRDCRRLYEQARNEIEPIMKDAMVNNDANLLKIRTSFHLMVSENAYERIKNCYSLDGFEKIREECLLTLAKQLSEENSDFMALVRIESNDERNRKCSDYVKTLLENLQKQFDDNMLKENGAVINAVLDIVQEDITVKRNELNSIRDNYNEMISHQGDSDFILHKIGENIVDVAYYSSVMNVLLDS